MSVWRTVSNPEQHRFSLGIGDPQLASGAMAGERPRAFLRASTHLVNSAWGWIQRARAAQTSVRRLRVAETVSFGEKRFVSIIQVDGAQFLIGGSATTVQLLTRLDAQGNGTAALLIEEQDPA